MKAYNMFSQFKGISLWMKKLARSAVAILAVFLLVGCQTLSESITSDIYVQKGYPLKQARNFVIGYFQIRTNVPYVKLNFKEQLEFHLLQNQYQVLPDKLLKKYYKDTNIEFNRHLASEEISELSRQSKQNFDLLIQGMIYEMDKTLYDEGNHIIVHLNLYSKQGYLVSWVRYIYTGERSLISGELIDEAVISLIDQLKAKSGK